MSELGVDFMGFENVRADRMRRTAAMKFRYKYIARQHQSQAQCAGAFRMTHETILPVSITGTPTVFENTASHPE